jgi:hypothetical protein
LSSASAIPTLLLSCRVFAGLSMPVSVAAFA